MTELIQDPMNDEQKDGFNEYQLAIEDDDQPIRAIEHGENLKLGEDDEAEPIIEDESEYQRKKRLEAEE